jgi:hypothetical protein
MEMKTEKFDENINLMRLENGPDKRLSELFLSPDTQTTAAVFFFFKKSGELVLEGRTGDTEESKVFLQNVMFILNSWISESENFND